MKNHKASSKTTRRSRNDRFRAAFYFAARQEGYPARTVKEYMNEAEHEAGSKYWAYFVTIAEALADFRTYVAESDMVPA